MLKYRSGNQAKLDWEQVITWKLTDGTLTNVPTRLGFWAGYRTSKAVASVIDVGIERPAWIARFKDRTTYPLPLREAKAAAIAMAKGACGDYVVSNPIAHLDGLTAILLERE